MVISSSGVFANFFLPKLQARDPSSMRGDKQGATLTPLPTWPVAPMTRILGLLFGIVRCRIGRRSLQLEEIVRARSVQSNAVDDQLRAGNVARILRQQESCCPGHFVGCAEPFQERLGGKRFFKPFQLVSGKADFL